MKKLISTFIAAALLLGSAAAWADPSVVEYEKGRPCYKKLMAEGGRSAREAQWRECITLFEDVYRDFPTSVKASSSLYSSGKLKIGLYGKTKKRADLEGAIKDLNLLVREFPKSSLADDCLYMIGVLRRDDLKQPERARRAFAYLVEHYPDGDMAPKARVELERLGMAPKTTEAAESTPAATEGGETAEATEVAVATEATAASPAARPAVTGDASAFAPATLSAVEIKEGEGATSVELVMDKNVEYTVEYTESGRRTKSPAELEISIIHTGIGDGIEKRMRVDSTQLASYKIKNLLLSSGLKASFKMAPGSRYDIKNADGVITVKFTGGDSPASPAEPAVPAEDAKEPKAHEQSSGLRIVIDPGHGGSDEGAVGPDGTKEKDVTLAISKRLAVMLRGKLGARVWLTRTSDKALTLDERDAIAVRRRADLFISIHANASTNRAASGIETYYLNNATDEAARRLALRENRAAKKGLSQVEHILSTMLQTHDTTESRALADQVQGRLAKRLGRFSGVRVRNRGVRSALFYVLVGAKCPAILVEAAFISNPREEKLLVNGKYQQNLAVGITEGVGKYLKQSQRRMVSL